MPLPIFATACKLFRIFFLEDFMVKDGAESELASDILTTVEQREAELLDQVKFILGDRDAAFKQYMHKLHMVFGTIIILPIPGSP